MSKNVLIPLSLLNCIIEFLIELDLSEYHELRYEYCEILWVLNLKKQRIGLRQSYAKILEAVDDDDRDDARMRYLLHRSSLDSLSEVPF